MTGSAASPLGQRIQRLLLARGGPIPLLELQTMLRRQGQTISAERLRGVLNDAATFVALANDRYALRDVEPVSPEPSVLPTPANLLLLETLPTAQLDYVVLDLETTGLDPEQDQVIQVAALRVRDTQPVEFRSWYIQCDPNNLPSTLRNVLHLTDELVAQIAAAPPLSECWSDIRAFLGTDPLVIHNARFDSRFLVKHDPALPNHFIDTLALAMLLLPHAAQHTLAALAASFTLDLAALAFPDLIGLPAAHRIGDATLHNAITDVMVLHMVYRSLLGLWTAQDPARAAVLEALLPELYGPRGPQPTALPTTEQPTRTHTRAQAVMVMPDAQELLAAVTTAGGLAPRTSQRTMVDLVALALASDRSQLIEAPTGTGKTLGYLLPAIAAARQQGRRIALATAYKNLQDQLRAEVARVQTVVPFEAHVLKGTASYLCLRNLNQALIDAERAALERRYVLAVLTHWALDPDVATLDELPFWLRQTFPELADIEQEVAADTATCTERRCPFYDRCHLYTAYRRAEDADILLINQSLWLAEPTAMPAFDALVIDEAHNLEDMATSAFREEVSEASLRRLLQQLMVPGTRRGALPRILDLKPNAELRTAVHDLRRNVAQSLQLLQELRTTLATFVEGCDERLDAAQGAQLRLTGAPARVYPTRWPLVQQALDQLWLVYLPAVVAGLSLLDALLPPDQEVLTLTLHAVHTRLLEQEQLLSTILTARRADLVAWIEIRTTEPRAGWGFHVAPVAVAPLLAERYTSLRSVILTSATLTTGPRDFGFFLDRLGLRGVVATQDIHALAGVLPYHTNVLLGLPTYLSYTPAQITMQSFVQELADELQLLFGYTDGRGLALFTARSRLEAVWERNHRALEARGIPVLAQRPGTSRHRLIDQFRTHGGAVLYGLKSFWEGVDVPGGALSIVAMEKLPYPALGDPIHTARREAVARQSGREFQDYLFPLMVLQFKQGCGRLLRQPDDQGAVILYDKRIARKSYLPDLLGALPGFQARDVTAERSRRAFYELLATRLPGLIDEAAKADYLAALPDVLLTDLEALVERLALPDPLSPDDYATWRPQILEALKALYGYEEFRSPEQEAATRAMLLDQELVAVLPTGAGKSLCFQLPALLRSGTTVICSPLIALMRDQIDKLHDRGIEIAAALMSGQQAAEREEVLARLRAGRLRLLYLAPERLRDPVVLAALAAARIRRIVVDEAHCVALWGPSFRPDFLVVPQLYQLLPARPAVAAFTATATLAITEAIVQGLALEQPTVIRASIDRPELRLVVLDRNHPYHPIRSKTDQIRRLTLLVQVADARGEAMLIYVATTKEAEYLARLLQVAGYAARAYHGRMPVQERTTVGELFMEGLISIVVCTKAFGMGIDKPDIRYVVHFNVPGDLESYAQEVGRAGRDGQPAYGILLYHPSDERIQRYFIDQSRPDGALLGNLWRWIASQEAGGIL